MTLDTSISAKEFNYRAATIEGLVCQAQAGDRDAFGELYERFQRHVLAIAYGRLGDYPDAQELCQDVFIQAMQKIFQLRNPKRFGSWLRSITHRMAIDKAVRRGHSHPTEPYKETSCTEEETPLVLAMTAESRLGVQVALYKLRAFDRKTLEAFYIRDLSLQEMSDEFNVPVGTVKRRLHVARRRLAKELSTKEKFDRAA